MPRNGQCIFPSSCEWVDIFYDRLYLNDPGDATEPHRQHKTIRQRFFQSPRREKEDGIRNTSFSFSSFYFPLSIPITSPRISISCTESPLRQLLFYCSSQKLATSIQIGLEIVFIIMNVYSEQSTVGITLEKWLFFHAFF